MNSLVTLLAAAILQTAVPVPAPPNSQAEAPQILVVKHSWTRVRYRQGWDTNTVPDPRRDPTNPLPPRTRLPRLIEGYSYRATLRNLGKKTVVLIAWDYTFKQPNDDEVEHHQFVRRINIKPGQQKELRGFDRKPPTRTVSAGEAERDPKGEVVVIYLEYEDGTSWRRIDFDVPRKF